MMIFARLFAMMLAIHHKFDASAKQNNENIIINPLLRG